MRKWSEDVWIAEAPLRFYGVPFGTRMTVVRLPDGGLWLHSPIALDDHLRAEIEALGPVRHVVWASATARPRAPASSACWRGISSA